MKLRVWPRTIRYQLLIGLVSLEALSLAFFSIFLLTQQTKAIHQRLEQRLLHQANSLALQSQEGLLSESPESTIATSVVMMGEAPSVASARITDPSGKVLFSSESDSRSKTLDPAEFQEIASYRAHPENKSRVFTFGSGNWESFKPVLLEDKLYGFAWVTTNGKWDQEQIDATISAISVFAMVWIGASLILGWVFARSITRSLDTLHSGTKALMNSPEDSTQFPLPVPGGNEVSDLIIAFNRMVASIEEQRAGLSDTLSLLDSMLANAPIGLAFFDRQLRFVRVNRVFCDATGYPLSRHLGRTLPEVLPASVAQLLEHTIQTVFQEDHPVRDVEVVGPAANEEDRPWTWITNAYPVHTAPSEVRWVGLIVMDASDRKQNEEALRRTEKLAATGRLAASIAHEINNPLEAITNLLYLLSNHAGLEEPARGYATMAEHEVRRISEITQQMLRFYRQSTLPARANLSELLDSVLSLHSVRLRNLGIRVESKYDASIDLYCFAGEIRQVFANLVGNAIDAMPAGGRLSVRARRSCSWGNPERSGVRFQVADTGAGMPVSVQKRIFEPFFTTKETTGTGLGLWVSSEIVAKHQGTIRVRSHHEVDGKPSGTVFELFFPDSVQLAPEAERAEQVASA